MSQLFHYSDYIISSQGRPLVSASIAVLTQPSIGSYVNTTTTPGSPLANIYYDAAGLYPMINPINLATSGISYSLGPNSELLSNNLVSTTINVTAVNSGPFTVPINLGVIPTSISITMTSPGVIFQASPSTANNLYLESSNPGLTATITILSALPGPNIPNTIIGTGLDGQGNFGFYAAQGYYTLQFYGDQIPEPSIQQDVQIGSQPSTSGTATGLQSATTIVGVSTAGAPIFGQVLTAINGNSASWQSPAAGASNATQIQSNAVASGTPLPGQSLVYKTTGATYTPAYAYKNLISVVGEYGADPTGLSDSSSAFQAALNAVTATRPGIYIPSGTYLIGTALTDPTSGLLQFVIGDGLQTTQLFTTGSNTILNFTHITSASTSVAFKIEGVSFKGGSIAPSTPYGTQNGVILEAAAGNNASFVKIIDCWFGYWNGYPLTINASGANYGSILGRIEGCQFIYCGNGPIIGNGISNDSTTLTILDTYCNFIVGNAFQGVNIQSVNLITCAVDNSGVAYLFQGCNAVTMTGCYSGSPVAYNQAIASIARSGTTVTATATNNFVAGQWAVISGYTSTFATAYNGFVEILSASPTQFTYTSPGGSGTVGTASGGVTSVYPGFGIYFGSNAGIGCQQCVINGFTSYYASTIILGVSIFVDQNSGNIDIDGFIQNTAGGLYDIYLAPNNYNVILRASSLIGGLFDGSASIIYAPTTLGAIWSNGEIISTNGLLAATPVNAQTANYTCNLYDFGTIISETTSANTTIFINTDAAYVTATGAAPLIGAQVTACQLGTGTVYLAATTPGTTTVQAPTGTTANTRAQYSFITATKMSNNFWIVSGDMF